MTITGDFVQGLKDKLGQVIKGAFKPAEHTHTQGEITNLTAALNNKQDVLTAGNGIVIEGSTISCTIASGGNVLYIGNLDTENKLNIDTTSEEPTEFGYGKLCFIINEDGNALSDLIEGSYPISYHQNAQDLDNKFFMIRVYRYLRGESDQAFFIEVAGAWNDPQ